MVGGVVVDVLVSAGTTLMALLSLRRCAVRWGSCGGGSASVWWSLMGEEVAMAGGGVGNGRLSH